MPDDNLLKQLIDGKEEAYTRLYNQTVNELYSYGVSLGYTKHTCMDAIHDVFYNVYTNRKKLGDVQNIKYYLFRSLKNRLIDIQKRETKFSPKDDVDEYSFSVEVSVVDTILTRLISTVISSASIFN